MNRLWPCFGLLLPAYLIAAMVTPPFPWAEQIGTFHVISTIDSCVIDGKTSERSMEWEIIVWSVPMGVVYVPEPATIQYRDSCGCAPPDMQELWNHIEEKSIERGHHLGFENGVETIQFVAPGNSPSGGIAFACGEL